MKDWRSAAAAETVRFRHFERRSYAAFRSMHKVINIGVISDPALCLAC